MNIVLHYFVIDRDIANGYSLIGDWRVLIANVLTLICQPFFQELHVLAGNESGSPGPLKIEST